MLGTRRSSDSVEIYNLQLRSFLILYILQGLPLGLQTKFLPVHLRSEGMSLSHLSYYRMLLAPWVLKGLWAPMIDRSGDLKKWLNMSHAALMMLCMVAAQYPPENLLVLALILFLIHLAVSIQDIALDGLLIDLMSPVQLVTANLVQVVGYKLGAVLSGGLFGILTEHLGWDAMFYVLASTYGLGYVIGAFFLPEYSHRRQSRLFDPRRSIAGFDDSNMMPVDMVLDEGEEVETSSFLGLLNIEGTAWLLPFVFVYKFGDQGVSSMFPMFMIDRGLDVAEVTFWSGFAGQIFSLAGSVLGGYIRDTMIESIRLFLILQAICLLVLWGCVFFWDGSPFIYACSVVFMMVALMASGAVTTCTFTLIMQLSQTVERRHRTSHYTLLASSEVGGRLLAATLSGVVTDHTSYLFTFGLLSLTSILVVPFAFVSPHALNIH